MESGLHAAPVLFPEAKHQIQPSLHFRQPFGIESHLLCPLLRLSRQLAHRLHHLFVLRAHLPRGPIQSFPFGQGPLDLAEVGQRVVLLRLKQAVHFGRQLHNPFAVSGGRIVPLQLLIFPRPQLRLLQFPDLMVNQILRGPVCSGDPLPEMGQAFLRFLFFSPRRLDRLPLFGQSSKTVQSNSLGRGREQGLVIVRPMEIHQSVPQFLQHPPG